MKNQLFLVLTLLYITASFAQAPSGIAELKFGEIIHFEDVSVEFVEVLSDSRCPKNVTCIRAGEAEVVVAIYRMGKFSHERKLIFDASGLILEKNVHLFSSEGLYIKGLALSPYPEGSGKINPEYYSMDLGFN